MTERPLLNKKLDSKTFRDFYYLKEKPADFCRKNNLPARDGKLELTDRIAHFLDTGEITPSSAVKKRRPAVSDINEDTAIETDFIRSERHRVFFKEQIGSHSSFNAALQK